VLELARGCAAGSLLLSGRALILVLLVIGVLALPSSQRLLRTACWAATQGRFSAEEFLEPIKFLSSDELKGRGDGTPELDRAAEYIAARFRKFGLKPAEDTGAYLQHFSLVVSAKLGPKNVAVYRQGSRYTTLKLQQDFVPLSFSANATIEATLVFAGYGITAPEYHYDDYQGLDATRRVVIVLRHEPQENDEHSIFAGRQMTSHADIANKAINAKNHGATAMILVSDLGNHPVSPMTCSASMK
jgi:hypothetical protein